MTPFQSAAVEAKFNAYLAAARRDMLALRELVFSVARMTTEVGEIEETLKWGEPAYLTRNGAGSSVRMDWKPKAPNVYAIYFNCNTTLVETFRTMFPRDFVFSGNRALLLNVGEKPPKDALRICIVASLTYHAEKRVHSKSDTPPRMLARK